MDFLWNGHDEIVLKGQEEESGNAPQANNNQSAKLEQA
jgi:hypothetical protein